MKKPYRLSWREMQRLRTDQLNTIYDLTATLGNVAQVNVFGTTLHLVSDPDVIRELLVKRPHQLHRDATTTRILGRLVGSGVFIAEDEAWQRQRKLIQPVFHAAHIHDFVDVFAEQTREMCASWPEGEVQQLDQEMMKLALQVICQTMFGTDIVHSVERIGALMHAAMVETEAQLRFGLPLPDWLPLPGLRRQRQALAGVHQLLWEIIRDHQEQLARGGHPNTDLLTMLLTARDEAGESLSEEQVLDECMTIFVAGHETTAVALTWTWALLLQHPEIFARLQREIQEVVGERPITYTDIKQLPYLTQVIKESLRYYPPAPGFGRTPTEPFSINDHDFNPGDTIIVSSYTLHRQAKFYPDPDRFCPDRFAADAEPPPRYAYIPFGAGSRTCIGNAFATLEMQVVLATMIQSVSLLLVPDQEIVPETLVTLRPKRGVQVRVEAQK